MVVHTSNLRTQEAEAEKQKNKQKQFLVPLKYQQSTQCFRDEMYLLAIGVKLFRPNRKTGFTIIPQTPLLI
jgi:hypothetical protein